MRYNTDWQSRVAPETGGNVHRPDCPHQGQAQGQVLMNTPKSTYVYFISVGSGPIKIGLSDDPKLQLAIEWLQAHPEHIRTESRKLGELIGVSHATANKAQHYILSQSVDTEVSE